MLQIPSTFLSAASEEEKKIINQLVENYYAEPTGSRYYHPASAKPKTDFDLFLFGADADLDLIDNSEWKSVGANSLSDDQEFVSLRRGRINIILCLNEDFQVLFRTATAVCKAIGGNLQNKRCRIQIFRAILYGEAPRIAKRH